MTSTCEDLKVDIEDLEGEVQEVLPFRVRLWENFLSFLAFFFIESLDKRDGTSHSTKSKRVDIQWLRAFSVLAVVLFHLDISFFQGGFIGVDVFFVISGYLVVGSMFRESERGTFSLIALLAKRIRRLIPASTMCLLFVLLLFQIFPFIQQYQGNSGYYDIFYASIYGSNINFFIRENAYFTTDSSQSFVLHFWSLSLEEQFYVFFGGVWFVWLCFSSVFLPTDLLTTILTCTLSLASFIVCMIPQLSNLKFFLLPSRIWEFLIGALVSLHGKKVIEFLRLKDVCDFHFSCVRITSYIALTLMSIFITSNEYPNGWTLIIVLISALILMIDIPIEESYITYIGDWSYSIYLYHYPLIMLYKNYDKYAFLDKVFNFQGQFILIVLFTFILAVISYYTIEQQCIKVNVAPVYFFLFALVVGVLLSVISMSLYTHPSFIYAHPHLEVGNTFSSNLTLKEVSALKYNAEVSSYVSTGFNDRLAVNTGGRKFVERLKGNGSGMCILFYGDSQALQYEPFYIHLAKVTGATILSANDPFLYKQSWFDEVSNNIFIELAKTDPLLKRCSHTITFFSQLSDKFQKHNEDFKSVALRFEKLFRVFDSMGCAVLFSGLPKRGEYNVNVCLRKAIHQEIIEKGIEKEIRLDFFNLTNNFNTINETHSPYNFVEKCSLTTKDILNFEVNHIRPLNVTVLDVSKYLCVDKKCPPNQREIPVYFDQSHLSSMMAEFLIPNLMHEINTLCPINKN